jgi:hypothetical protein
MSTKSKLLQQISNFIDELNTTFPNNNDIEIFKEKFLFLKSVNSQLIVEYFIKFIYPLKESILNQDENFFLEGGGQDEVKDKNGLNMRDNLKNLWIGQMSDDNKIIVWKYFKIFILLSEKYIKE